MSLVEVASGVFHGRGTDVNFWLLREGDELTLIDCGYPGDVPVVEAAIASLGLHPRSVRAVLLTHAHVDHIGAAEPLRARYGVPTYTGSDESAHARREYLQQANPRDVVREAWRPAVLRWALRVTRQGATRPCAVPQARPFAAPGALDLPGRPVPVPMPGHTSGHTAYLLPSPGAIATGDGLVTGHPLLRGTGPRLLPALFQHGDPHDGLAAIEELDADLLLPGHGDALRMPVRDAVAVARQLGM